MGPRSSPCEGAILREEGKERPIVKYRNTLRTVICTKRLNRSRCRWPIGSGEPKESCVRRVQIPVGKGNFKRGRRPVVMCVAAVFRDL